MSCIRSPSISANGLEDIVRVKVEHVGTVRQIVFDKAEASWTQFASKVKKVFRIPDATSISAFYIDKDGDSIQIDSDIEIQDLLKLERGRVSASVPKLSIIVTPSLDTSVEAFNDAHVSSAEFPSSTSQQSDTTQSILDIADKYRHLNNQNAIYTAKERLHHAKNTWNEQSRTAASAAAAHTAAFSFFVITRALKAAVAGPKGLKEVGGRLANASKPAFEGSKHASSSAALSATTGAPSIASVTTSASFSAATSGATRTAGEVDERLFNTLKAVVGTVKRVLKAVRSSSSLKAQEPSGPPPGSTPRWKYTACVLCGSKGFTGPQYKCKTCRDYNICSVCYHASRENNIGVSLEESGGHSSSHEFTRISVRQFTYTVYLAYRIVYRLVYILRLSIPVYIRLKYGVEGWNYIANHYKTSPNVVSVRKEIDEFIGLVSRGSSTNPSCSNSLKLKNGWSVVGVSKFPALAQVARILLAIPASQTSSELYDTKGQNRLGVKKAIGLVLMYINAKLRENEISPARVEDYDGQASGGEAADEEEGSMVKDNDE
ncbi:hypothetical protein HDU99_001374 [Rhizoclosmatium hyalinum]|nr:hypothetical protein HDU99_001374 [Rhizoclosmatium hyalinum]